MAAKRGPCPRCQKRARNKKSTYCKPCGAAKAKETYDANKERERKRTKAWRRNNPEKAKAAQARYRESPEGKKKRREYRNSERGQEIHAAWQQSPEGKRAMRAAEKRYRQKIKNLTADLPIEVVRPFVERMVREADMEHVHGGQKGETEKGQSPMTILANLVGVKYEDIRQIMSRRIKKVSVDVADALARHGDFTLNELYDRAAEWALLTDSSWPHGYRSKRKPGPKPRKALQQPAKTV